MHLIIGLGNPGQKYQINRHNIGFLCLDYLIKIWNLENWKINKKFLSQISKNPNIILAKPQTFMNNSGQAASKIFDYFQINLPNILIIYDDLDLPFGKVRLKQNGKSAGHNGIKSIQQHLPNSWWRLRIGIGQTKCFQEKTFNKKHEQTTQYVLGNLSNKELQQLQEKTFPLCQKMIQEFITEGPHSSMNKFHDKS